MVPKETNDVTILCIDDDPDVLNLLKKILTGAGYSVIVAGDGKRGIEEALSRQPDLILMDVMMPEIDGYVACFELQSNPDTKFIPVIFLTALDDEVNRAKAFAVGAADHLAKPIRKDILLKKIDEQIKTSSRWQKLKTRIAAKGEIVQPPAIFSQFKQSLLNFVEPAQAARIRDRLSALAPQDIYNICEPMGIPPRQMTGWISEFLSIPIIAKIDRESLLLGGHSRFFRPGKPGCGQARREERKIVHSVQSL